VLSVERKTEPSSYRPLDQANRVYSR